MISKSNPSDARGAATSLRQLPIEEREKILSYAAGLAESEYTANPELTDFEAFGENDLYGQSASSEG